MPSSRRSVRLSQLLYLLIAIASVCDAARPTIRGTSHFLPACTKKCSIPQTYANNCDPRNHSRTCPCANKKLLTPSQNACLKQACSDKDQKSALQVGSYICVIYNTPPHQTLPPTSFPGTPVKAGKPVGHTAPVALGKPPIDDSGLSTGASVGIGMGVGLVTVLLCVALLGLFFKRKRNRRKRETLDNSKSGVDPDFAEKDGAPVNEVSPWDEMRHQLGTADNLAELAAVDKKVELATELDEKEMKKDLEQLDRKDPNILVGVYELDAT